METETPKREPDERLLSVVDHAKANNDEPNGLIPMASFWAGEEHLGAIMTTDAPGHIFAGAIVPFISDAWSADYSVTRLDSIGIDSDAVPKEIHAEGIEAFTEWKDAQLGGRSMVEAWNAGIGHDILTERMVLTENGDGGLRYWDIKYLRHEDNSVTYGELQCVSDHGEVEGRIPDMLSEADREFLTTSYAALRQALADFTEKELAYGFRLLSAAIAGFRWNCELPVLLGVDAGDREVFDEVFAGVNSALGNVLGIELRTEEMGQS